MNTEMKWMKIKNKSTMNKSELKNLNKMSDQDHFMHRRVSV